MYLDYSDGKEKRLPTTMLIKIKNNKIISEIKFPGEPKANSKNTTKIKKKGTYFGNEKVIEKSILEDETLKVVTFFEGKDNNKKAKMYKTYLYSKEKITIVKEVMYFNSDEKFIRNKQEFIKTQKL